MEATQLVRIKDWSHAPVHPINPLGVYIVTGATLHKQHFFRTPEALDLLEDELLTQLTNTNYIFMPGPYLSIMFTHSKSTS